MGINPEAVLDDTQLKRAKQWITEADAILVGAGAGMGVDSGLPDFRGNEGFWRAYPRFKSLGLSFTDLANPRWFHQDPAQAWGFYGHRYRLYQNTQPHRGFTILRQWMEEKQHGGFVFTSNVDGQFQKAGFANQQIVECHGSINHLQCVNRCCGDIWPAPELEIHIDPMLRAQGELPHCPRCGGIARPNILMFGDGDWIATRTSQQIQRYQAWLGTLDASRLVVIELGAGLAIPTVRYECESRGGRLLRINPRDSQVPAGAICFPAGALRVLEKLDMTKLEA